MTSVTPLLIGVILYLCGGVLNYYVILYSPVYINLSIVGLALCLSYGVFRILRVPTTPGDFRYTVWFATLFLAWVLASYLWSPSTEYGLYKTISLTSNLIIFFMVIFFARDRKFLASLDNTLIPIGVVLGILYILFGNFYSPFAKLASEYANDGGRFAKAIYLTTSQLLSFIIVFSVVLNRKGRALKTIALVFMYLVILISGARSALIFTLMFHGLVMMARPGAIHFGIKQYFLIATFIGSMIYAWVKFELDFNMIDRVLERFGELFSFDDGGRLAFIQVIYDKSRVWYEMLFGHGIGGFGIARRGVDVRDYPHNLFFDLFYELGLVGVVVFTLFLMGIFKMCFKCFETKRERVTALVIGMLPLLELMKSSTYAEYRIFWVSMAIMIIYSVSNKKKIGYPSYSNSMRFKALSASNT